MNEELLELSSMLLELENKGEKISTVVSELANEFTELEKVSVQELIFKLSYR